MWDPASRREVMRALCAMPEDARRVAFEDFVIAGVGLATAGMALGPSTLAGARWVLPLAERTGIGGTLAHEIAHAILGHKTGGLDREREAAALAREWGFDGPSADPDRCADALRQALERGTSMRAAVVDGALAIECECGSWCRVVAPTVPGLAAKCGVECPACGWYEIVGIGELRACPTCATRTVLWAPDATPSEPAVRWDCDCGETHTIRCDVPGPVTVSEERWATRTAADALVSVARTLRNLDAADPDMRAVSTESCRAAVWFAHERLVRLAQLRPGADVEAWAVEVAEIGRRIGRGELSGAADRLAAIAAEVTR